MKNDYWARTGKPLGKVSKATAKAWQVTYKNVVDAQHAFRIAAKHLEDMQRTHTAILSDAIKQVGHTDDPGRHSYSVRGRKLMLHE